MYLQIKNVRQGINKAYLKVNVKRADLDVFKEEATAYLNNLDQAEGKDEEHHKAYLRDFLKDTFYSKEERLVNTSRNVDLGIYSGKTTSSTLEVIIEAKKPGNTREMITKDNPNAKALQEALLYYFEEREAGNEDLKQVVITNYTEFFFFDAQEIERNFYSKKSLVKTFRNWKNDQKVSSNTDFMYGKFGKFILASDANLNGIYLNLKDFKSKLAAPASEDHDKKLIPLYKLFSPEHLVKKPFANDSNSLDKRFYNELLHILGLQEVKEKGSRLIRRLPEKERQRGSLIENTIEILRYDQHMNEVREAKVQYGEEEDDQLFGVALELVITWMNRVLFLKLMEAQLLGYHQQDEHFKFLGFDSIDEYDELNKLFFRVLALRNEERPPSVQERFGHIPYLNSSLFDSTTLEKTTIQISGLDDKAILGLYSRSVLKKGANPPTEKLNTLDYLLRFLDAYNFSAESSGGIQTEDKTLINASVLGLIFEKINGYKDGSFFTPGFITEYMARETLRKAVIDKFAATLTPGPSPAGGRGEQNSDRVEEPGWKLPESLLENARHLRKNQTDAEKLLWGLLRNRQFYGYKFRRQHPIKPGFVLDFYCAENKLAVELDGGIHNEEEQKISDDERTGILNEKGINVIRFRNEDVLNNTNKVLKELAGKLGVYGTNFPSPAGGRGVPEGRGEGGLGEDGKLTLTDISNRIGRDISIRKANEIINSITICDPAVGSGHFLVSCLNELIAIKSDLKILCDHEGKRIPYLDIEVENDELAIEHEGELFEYKLNHKWENGKVIRKPAGSDRQRVQVALFHEKKFLIENCLFGVDINPNSVKICRLRLWIELLKHAYYRPHPNPLPEGEGMNQRKLRKGEGEYSELEVLPNIDINIKQGNSLVSRFGLDEDLSSIFKKSDHSLEDYKQAVRSYRETRDRNEKQRLQHLIDDIKAEYSENLLNNKPINKKLSKARGKLDLMQNEDLFGEGKATKKELKKQEQKVTKLEKQKAEEEAGAFYREAFEWRFEFPEVLDEEGKYIGFDVVIANPPYGSIISKSDKDYYKKIYSVAEYNFDVYNFFFECSLELLRSKGILSFITPNTYLVIENGKKLRELIFDRCQVIALIDTYGAFEEAVVETIITLLKKERTDKNNLVKIADPGRKTKRIDESSKFSKKQSFLISNNFGPVNYKIKDDQKLLYDRLNNGFDKLESLSKISAGLKPYETGKGTPPQKREVVKKKPFTSDKPKGNDWTPLVTGTNINRYGIVGNTKFIKYGPWLAAPRDPEIFKSPKLFIRRTDDSIKAAFDSSSLYGTNSIHCLNMIEPSKDLLLQVLAILNSELIDWYYKVENFHMVGKPLAEVKIVFLNRLPIQKIVNNELVDLVNQILTAKKENPESDTSKLEAEIDRLVYDLYGLSEEEIGIVEGSV